MDIDRDTTAQLVHLMKMQPGEMSIAFDGVTVNSVSKTLFTVSIGSVSMFVEYQDLGSDVHVTAAETKSAFDVCMRLKEQFGVKVSAIPADNAATTVANNVVNLLEDEGDNPIVNRDLAHTIDLPCKDLVDVSCVKEVMDASRYVSMQLLAANTTHISHIPLYCTLFTS